MPQDGYEYLQRFRYRDKLPLSNWLVVRIDGFHFHQFSTIHEFEKPNDENALNLMNFCAIAMFEKFPCIVFAYGESDEYSFIWKKTRFQDRRMSDILSSSVSFFTSVYVMKWKDFFPSKELKVPPSFDGRVVCYPETKLIRDYLAWRQVDCHINNQYNTCFWTLVKSGKTKQEAQQVLKGTQSQEKNDLLLKFGIVYNDLPAIFRKGSSIYRDEVEEVIRCDASENLVNRTRKVVKLLNCDIIGADFWSEHPSILSEE